MSGGTAAPGRGWEGSKRLRRSPCCAVCRLDTLGKTEKGVRAWAASWTSGARAYCFQLSMLPHGSMEQVCVQALWLSMHHPRAAGSSCLSIASECLLQFSGLVLAKPDYIWVFSDLSSESLGRIPDPSALHQELHSTKSYTQNVALAFISWTSFLVPYLLPRLCNLTWLSFLICHRLLVGLHFKPFLM